MTQAKDKLAFNAISEQQQAAMLDTLSQVEGINTERALQAMSGQSRLYLKLVRSFTIEQQQRSQELTYLNETKQWEILARRIHSLKTYSAYIGAYKISSRSAKLESLLKHNEYDANERDIVSDICQRLEQLLIQLNQVFKLDPDNQPKTPVHFTLIEFKKLLMTILPLLQKANSAVDNVLPELLTMSQGTDFETNIEQLVDLVDDIEFEKATDLVQTLLQQLN